jgi:flavin-dependent dehydrogenase
MWRYPTIDERDEQHIARSVEALNKARQESDEPLDGDFVVFADGVRRRVSEVLPGGYGVQTSNAGSWYLSELGVSFTNGSLYLPVPKESLTLTDETCDGQVWFFHHNYTDAGNGVNTAISFRVYRCSEPAPAI